MSVIHTGAGVIHPVIFGTTIVDLYIEEGDAFGERNPLRYNSLLSFKVVGVPDYTTSHICLHDQFYWDELIDMCVRCSHRGFGPLCDEHKEEVLQGDVELDTAEV